jgi:serine phosphatase RsbU (regulator of sigma subunit)/anti-sigma regulatory factor (Ser/Thr protein kinase)
MSDSTTRFVSPATNAAYHAAIGGGEAEDAADGGVDGGRLLEAVLDNAPMGMAFVGRDLIVARSNAAFDAMPGFDTALVAADVEAVFATATPILNRELALADQQWLLSHFPVTVDGEVIWVGTVATDLTVLRRAERERADLLTAERRARTAAERMAVRLARLQAITARLTAAADADEVALVVCDHGAAGLGAASGALFLLSEDGATFEMTRETGYGPTIASAFSTFAADAPLPVADAVRTRSMVLLTGHEERDRRYPALRDTPLTTQSHAVLPLVFGDSVLGAVSFSFTDVRAFDDDDRRFLLALASQASQALERARLHDLERELARRQELLAETSRLLTMAMDSSESLRAVAQLLVRDIADGCSVQLVEDNEMRLVAAVHGDPDREVEVLRSGIGDEGTGRMIVMPLRARGVDLGALLLSREATRRPFDDRAVALVADVADRIAVAVDNGRAQRAREERAQTLQASLLPPRLPVIDGLTIDSRYQPVGDGSLVGGDFYDVFPLGTGRWGLMIGDVCGQGVVAASLTSLVRYTARAAARQWRSPAEVLRFTNAALADHDLGERFCTALYAVIEPDELGADLTIAIGGHHQPLLHRPGVGVRPVGAIGSALGLMVDADVEDVSMRLQPDDLLVLFTDGVIEARHPGGEQVGESFLEDLVEAHAADGPAAVGAAVERAVLDIGGGRARDDMAVVTIGIGGGHQRVAPAPVDANFEQRYAADIGSVPIARANVREWMLARKLVAGRLDDVLVVITELTTNAVRSARTAVEVRAWVVGTEMWFEVIDDGPGFDPSIPHDARELDPLAERGRGLFLVATLADECTIESGPNGTIVRCAVMR